MRKVALSVILCVWQTMVQAQEAEHCPKQSCEVIRSAILHAKITGAVAPTLPTRCSSSALLIG